MSSWEPWIAESMVPKVAHGSASRLPSANARLAANGAPHSEGVQCISSFAAEQCRLPWSPHRTSSSRGLTPVVRAPESVSWQRAASRRQPVVGSPPLAAWPPSSARAARSVRRRSDIHRPLRSSVLDAEQSPSMVRPSRSAIPSGDPVNPSIRGPIPSRLGSGEVLLP